MAKKNNNEVKKALLEIAMEMFTSNGYIQTGTEDIVKKANVTRGALYYHFKNKEDLFVNIFEQIQHDIANKMAESIRNEDFSWEKLISACNVYVKESSKTVNSIICFEQAPMVIGWEKLRELENKHTLGVLKKCIYEALIDKEIDNQPLDSLAQLIFSMLNEIAQLKRNMPSSVSGEKCFEWMMSKIRATLQLTINETDKSRKMFSFPKF